MLDDGISRKNVFLQPTVSGSSNYTSDGIDRYLVVLSRYCLHLATCIIGFLKWLNSSECRIFLSY